VARLLIGPAVATAVVATLVGCGDDGGVPPAADAAAPTPRFDDGAMRIDVRQAMTAAGASTAIVGALAPEPGPWPYDPPTVDGWCRLMVRHPIDGCAPACPPTATCDRGACVAPATPRSAGVLTVGGGGARARIPFDGTYELYLATALFPPGADVTASAPGDALPAFTLTARMPPPLARVDPGGLALAPGRPLTVRWTPAGDASRVRIRLGADRGDGPWPSIVVECDRPDDAGEVAVPQAMVDALADPEAWGCDVCLDHEAVRYQRADTTLAGTTLTLWTSQAAPFALRP